MAIVPIIHVIYLSSSKKTLTMAELRINIMELRQIIRLKKEGISNRKVADMLHLSRNARFDEIISLCERGDP